MKTTNKFKIILLLILYILYRVYRKMNPKASGIEGDVKQGDSISETES